MRRARNGGCRWSGWTRVTDVAFLGAAAGVAALIGGGALLWRRRARRLPSLWTDELLAERNERYAG